MPAVGATVIDIDGGAAAPSPVADAANLVLVNRIGCAWCAARAATALAGLALSHAHGEHCADRPLQLWLLVLALIDLVRVPLRLHVLGQLARLRRAIEPAWPDALQRGIRMVSRSRASLAARCLAAASLAWHGVGGLWLASAPACERSSPRAQKVVVVLLAVLAAFIALNALCGCVYVALYVVLRFGGGCGLLPPLAGAAAGTGRAAVAPEAPKGLSRQGLAQLVVRMHRPPPHPQPPAACAICLADMQEGDHERVLLCGHAFHQACVDQWFNVSAYCPLCKQDMDLLCKALATDPMRGCLRRDV